MHTILSLLAILALASGCTATTTAAPSPPEEMPIAPQPASTQRTAVVQSIAGVNQANWWPDFSGISSSSKGCMRSLQAGRFAMPLPLVEGDRLLSLTVAVLGDGFVDVYIDPFSAKPDGSLTVGVLGSIAVQNAPPTWTDYTVDLVDTTVGPGASHWFEVAASSSGACVGAFRLTYDHPQN